MSRTLIIGAVVIEPEFAYVCRVWGHFDGASEIEQIETDLRDDLQANVGTKLQLDPEIHYVQYQIVWEAPEYHEGRCVSCGYWMFTPLATFKMRKDEIDVSV